MPKYNWKPEVRGKVLQKYRGHCAYCGCELGNKWHLDHFIPKRRGDSYSEGIVRGDDNIENYMPSCASCNSCKSDLDIEDFRERIYSRIKMLSNYSEYNIALRFRLIQELDTPVVFYFEKMLHND